MINETNNNEFYLHYKNSNNRSLFEYQQEAPVSARKLPNPLPHTLIGE